MNARHAARQLALLTLFQMDKQGIQASDRLAIHDLIIASVRALVDEARTCIQQAVDELVSVQEALRDTEHDHPDNLTTPLDAPIKPVPFNTTADLNQRVEQCLQAAEWLFEAIDLPEWAALTKQQDIQDYAKQLIQLVKTNQSELDEAINACSTEWRMDRLVLIDAWILRLAAAEMTYQQSVDVGVSIDEAVELAKRFSTDESYKFINGVLGALANRLGHPYTPPPDSITIPAPTA